MEKFKYLGIPVTNTSDIREQFKRTINMGNTCYYSLGKILSSRLLTKILKVNPYKTIILPVVLYVHRCGTGDGMRAYHAAGPGSIHGRDKFPG